MPAEQLPDVVAQACATHGDRIALVDQRALTYQELGHRVRETAEVLADRLGTDRRRVGIFARNSAEYVVTYYALIQVGHVPFLVDPEFGAAELEEIWAGCAVADFLVDHDQAGFPLPAQRHPLPGLALLRLAPPAAGTPTELDPATVTCRFTSGTTGAPKCLEFSHEAVLNAARGWLAGSGLDAGDRTLCLAALTNGLAFNTSLLSTVLVGAQLHLYQGLPTSTRVRHAVAAADATRLVAFPMVYRLLAEAASTPDGDGELAGRLRLAVSAGAPLRDQVRARFEDRYRVRIANYYGIAEVGPCTFEPDPGYRRGLGKPLPGVELRTDPDGDDGGRVLVRTRSMATRYLNAPGLLESRLDDDGFYRSGDTGQLTDGRLFLTGRVGEVPINLAGRKVDATEIEQVVCGLPGTTDAVVLPEPGDTGDTVLHLVVAGAAGQRPDRDRVVRACRERLAGYKVPAQITFVPEIPRSAAGKPRLTALQQLIGEQRRDDDQ